MVYYRKYRPQTIDELDSKAVKQALKSVLSTESIPHAFLFTGSKGLGKTSTARIVAKYVNCEGTGEKPCNMCTSCLSITNGSNLDVLEMDAASNRGIDEMRDLREKIKLLPVSAKKKVYIIDEVHMLTTESFNALLKTLEEPPPHAMFVLCTTEAHKVPATIVSRCFHIQFKKPTESELIHAFDRIIKAEKLQIETSALETIASFADGSFRDGVKILEEIVIGANGEKITQEMIKKVYHTTTVESDIIALLYSLQQYDTKKGFEIVQGLIADGTNVSYFLEQVLSYLHRLLLIQVGISEEKEKITLDLDTIKQLVIVLSKAHEEIKTAVLPQLPLELAIVEWGFSKGEGERVHPEGSPRGGKGFILKDHPEGKEETEKKEPVIARSEATRQSPQSDDKTFFYQLLDAIKGEHHMLAGILRSCKIVKTEAGITIEAPSVFHKEKLTEKQALDFLEKVCKDLTGKNITVSIVLKT